MPRRKLDETGCYHITARTAGQIALFEEDDDRRLYLKLLRKARDDAGARIIAWMLMTDHIHLVVDFGNAPATISDFMFAINSRYSKYFNAKTGRSGTLFQGRFWSKPISNETQLIATVHYIHMNPEAAGMAPMREYRWSSYQEYAGKKWVVDTSLVLGIFGSFEAFDSYGGSPKDAVRRTNRNQKEESMGKDLNALELALRMSGTSSSSELRELPARRRDSIIRELRESGVSARRIARVFGIGRYAVHTVLGK